MYHVAKKRQEKSKFPLLKIFFSFTTPFRTILFISLHRVEHSILKLVKVESIYREENVYNHFEKKTPYKFTCRYRKLYLRLTAILRLQMLLHFVQNPSCKQICLQRENVLQSNYSVLNKGCLTANQSRFFILIFTVHEHNLPIFSKEIF